MPVLIAGTRYRIVTTLVPRMAAGNALQGQPRTFQCTMRLDSFEAVAGTGGGKSAMVAKHWTQQVAIGMNEY